MSQLAREREDLGVQIVVVAKEPRPGAVKTRLCPPLSPHEAAIVAEAALIDTMQVVARCRVRRRLVALDGAPGPWLPSNCEVMPQRPGPFAGRLEGAIEDAWARNGLPVLLIGMDTPQLEVALLESAAQALLTPGVDASLGPAEDGGYWLLGTRRPVSGMFAGVPMSTDRTAQVQLARLGALALRCSLLPMLRDVDTYADALAVARSAPHSVFASAIRALGAAVETHA